jgi:hypothetical protein
MLREIPVPGTEHVLLLKEQRINPEYPLNRQISFYLRNYVKHYGRQAYRGAELLRAAGIPTPEPIGYWKNRHGMFRYTSCYLVKKDSASVNAKQYLLSKEEECKKRNSTVIREMALLARRIHDAGLLHGDLVANNYLVTSISPDGESASLTVVDTDHTIKNPFPLSIGGRLLSMRCFRRWHLSLEEQRLFLREYFAGEYHPCWELAIKFWAWLDKRPLRKLRALIPGYRVYQKGERAGRS